MSSPFKETSFDTAERDFCAFFCLLRFPHYSLFVLLEEIVGVEETSS